MKREKVKSNLVTWWKKRRRKICGSWAKTKVSPGFTIVSTLVKFIVLYSFSKVQELINENIEP